MYRGLIALVLPFASAALAEGPMLQSPIDCDLTSPCYIQQYVDRDPGTGVADFACGTLSYDGHKGTDFALPDRATMGAGVNVLAAAPGLVLGTRDGMDDDGYTPGRRAELEGRECGNGVVLQHALGWQTQYCHLQQGSVAVKEGQAIAAGTVLGRVGQSGNAAFPHLHLSVRDPDGAIVDPFDPGAAVSCDAPAAQTLWADPPAYRAAGLISTGFTDAIPEFDAIKAGDAAAAALPLTAPALVIFAQFFGPRASDVLELQITGPQGQVIADRITLTRDQALAFRAIGKRRRSAPWTAGGYTGTAILIRAGKEIDRQTTGVTLR